MNVNPQSDGISMRERWAMAFLWCPITERAGQYVKQWERKEITCNRLSIPKDKVGNLSGEVQEISGGATMLCEGNQG